MSDLFQSDPSDDTVPQIDPAKEYLPELVGDGKKYKSPEDLAKAALHKDQFIDQLKREQRDRDATIARLQSDLEARIKQEDFLTKVETLVAPKLPEAGGTPPADGTNGTPAVTPETIEKILEQRDATKQRQANLRDVETRLKEVYGDDYKRRVQEQARTLGVGTDFLTDVAAKNPSAFYRLVGVDSTQNRVPPTSQSAPPRSSVSIPSTPGQVKDQEYYRTLRKKVGDAAYFTPAIQQEIWKSATELGDAFYRK